MPKCVFGRTLIALELIKRMKLKKMIIITHRPVVNEGWYGDFTKIFSDLNIPNLDKLKKSDLEAFEKYLEEGKKIEKSKNI